jgi:transposase
MIPPHKENRKSKPTRMEENSGDTKEDGKWKELFAWIQNFRRCNTRYEYYEANFLGFIQLACIIILIRNYF